MALGLGGCAASLRDKPLIGEPVEALRTAPTQPLPYPNVYPAPKSTTKPMTQEERAKMAAELTDRRAKAIEERRKRIQAPSKPSRPPPPKKDDE